MIVTGILSIFLLRGGGSTNSGSIDNVALAVP